MKIIKSYKQFNENNQLAADLADENIEAASVEDTTTDLSVQETEVDKLNPKGAGIKVTDWERIKSFGRFKG